MLRPRCTIFRKDHETRGGSAARAVQDCFFFCTEPESSHETYETEQIWCSVKLRSRGAILRAVYRPFRSSVDFVEKLDDIFSHPRVAPKKDIMAGDFNLGGIDWKFVVVGNRDVDISSAFLETVFSHDLTQVVEQSTWVQGSSKSTLDLVFLIGKLLDYTHES